MKKTCCSLFIFLLLSTVLAACGSSDSDNAPRPLSQETQRELETIINNVMSRDDVPGVVVGIWKSGFEPWLKAKGFANIESGEALKITDRFRIASNTKTFTATVILQLIEEGKLRFDDTLDQFIPEIPGSDKITVRNLLNMTSGLYEIVEDQVFQDSYFNDPLRVWTHQEIIDRLVSHAPYKQPGTEVVYCNTNYQLLGMIIEQVTGSEAEQEIFERIILPLGLEATSFPTRPEIDGVFSHGYRDKIRDEVLPGLEDITHVDPSFSWTAGAMISNLFDLQVWVKALAEGTLLFESMQSERLHWLDINEYVKYGLGIANICGLVGHDGTILGFNSGVFYLPKSGSTLIVLVNKCNDDDAQPGMGIAIEIAKLVFPDEFNWPQ